MLKILFILTLSTSLAFSLTACGGESVNNSNTTSNNESTDNTEIEIKNTPPSAIVGKDQNVLVGQVVTLDGSGSSDQDGDTLTYKWEITSKPTGSNFSLSNISNVKPTFKPDIEGLYTFYLVVSDASTSTKSNLVKITVTKANSIPIANAGSDQNVNTYELVTLNGSSSSDADGDSLTYAWSLDSKPQDSTVTLTNSTLTNPSFAPDKDGQYTLSLIVNDGQASSQGDSVIITATTANAKPIAKAGSDQVQFNLNEITLNASESSDSDGDTLSYQWSITSAPSGNSKSLTNANSVTSTFTPDIYGDYVFAITVNDGVEDSLADSITVQVIDPLKKQEYLASNVSAYNSSASYSSINGYVQAGSKFVLAASNNNTQTINWKKVEIKDANNYTFVTSSDSSVLSGGSLTASETGNVQFTLSTSRKSPFIATFYWEDPIDGNKQFSTTLEFVKPKTY